MDDVICIILSNLNLWSLLNIRAVDRYYHNCITNKKINKNFNCTIIPKQVQPFTQINKGKGIKNINYNLVIRGQVTFNSLELGQIPNIKSLQILNRSIKDEHIKVLTDLESLVILEKSKITVNSLTYLTNLVYLNSLKDLSSYAFVSLPKLKYLRTRQRPKASVLSKLTNLIELSSPDLTSRDLQHLTNLTSLSSEEIYGTDLFSGLSNLSKLKKLNLGKGVYTSYDYVKYLTMLETLTLNTKMSKEGFGYLTNLTDLSVWGEYFQNDYIKCLTKLKALELSNNQSISENGLQHLPQLTCLKLINCRCSLNMLTQLKNLTLNNASLIEFPYRFQFKHLSGLLELNLTNNNNVKKTDIFYLTNLISLRVINNEIIENQDIGHLTKLKELYTIKSKITPDIINKLPNLENLYK